jgi:hypothetical protein
MNGRVYDPMIGRFLSPDPYVQAPESSQNFNRYSYALNNPLKYTDPSGYFFLKFLVTIGQVVTKTIVGVVWMLYIGVTIGAGLIGGMALGGAIGGPNGAALGAFFGGVAGFYFGASTGTPVRDEIYRWIDNW